MTNPVDDLGNPRIDFVWGNIPMQPDDERDGTITPLGGEEGDAGWGSTAYFNSDTLNPELDSHIIATSGYEGFPAFIQGAPYDDTVANAVMPNIVGMTQIQAEAALAAAGFESWINNDTTSGATSQNNNKVASQYPGVGTVLNTTDQPQATYYDYVAPATTGPIAGFNRLPVHFSLNSNQSNMFVAGRTVKPTVGDTISVTGSSDSAHNATWTVLEVVNDDSYNTGGTAIKVEGPAPSSDTSTGGTWTKTA